MILIDVGRCCREQGRFCLPFQATPRARFSSNSCSISALVAISAAPGKAGHHRRNERSRLPKSKTKLKAQKLLLVAPRGQTLDPTMSSDTASPLDFDINE